MSLSFEISLEIEHDCLSSSPVLNDQSFHFQCNLLTNKKKDVILSIVCGTSLK